MFTSRAEYRILLRQDNADIRLTERSYDLGLACEKRLNRLHKKQEETDKALHFLKKNSITPEDINDTLENKNTSIIKQKTKLSKILSRPQIKIDDFLKIKATSDILSKIECESLEQAEIQIKYDGYISREKETAEKLTNLENIKIPENFDYQKLGAMSSESKEKLFKIKPRSIGQATRISGVKPSDINVLLVYMGR